MGKEPCLITLWQSSNKFDASFKFKEHYAGERIPTLAEVFQLIDGKAVLLIEVKKGEDYYDGLEAAVLKEIRAFDAYDWCEVQSFYDHVLKNFAELDDTIVLHKLLVGKTPVIPFYIDHELRLNGLMLEPRYTGMNPNHGFARQGFIKEMQKKGFKVYTWTVNEEEKMRKLINYGVNGIITNYPDKARALIDN